jgi:hypothetical protein
MLAAAKWWPCATGRKDKSSGKQYRIFNVCTSLFDGWSIGYLIQLILY